MTQNESKREERKRNGDIKQRPIEKIQSARVKLAGPTFNPFSAAPMITRGEVVVWLEL